MSFLYLCNNGRRYNGEPTWIQEGKRDMNGLKTSHRYLEGEQLGYVYI